MDGNSEELRDFIVGLWKQFEAPHCPETVNLVRRFRDYLHELGGRTKEDAEESALRLRGGLLKEMELRISDWERSGLPRPVCAAETDNLFVTWRHRNYETLTGRKPLHPSFAEVSQWIAGLTPRGFLVPCVLYLRTIGATRIFVTDGPNDEGVDIIALVGRGGLQSTALFCQVKTLTTGSISRSNLLAEYGKFLALPHTKKYHHYRDALGLDRSIDGTSYCYAFITNQGFAIPARRIAASLGVLLRSRIQIAHWLTEHLTLAEMVQAQATIGKEPPIDLYKNLAAL